MPPKTMFEKIWADHVVAQEPGEPAVIYIDLHLVHDGTKLSEQFSQTAVSGFVAHFNLFRPEHVIVAMELVPVRVQHLQAGRERLDCVQACIVQTVLPVQ